MRKVELTMNEQHKYETIKKVADGLMTKSTAEVKLGISRRQVDRLLLAYRNGGGKETFRHKNRGRKSKRATDNKTKNKITNLYLSDKYCDSNFTHFTELLLKHKINLSRTTVSSVLREKDIISPMAHRKTRKQLAVELKAQLNDKLPKQKAIEIEEKIIAIEEAHPLRPRCKYRGELLQMDASKHFWVDSEYWHLHAAIDDASGDITGAYFSKEETLDSYYHVMNQTFTNHGIPHKCLTDYRSVFNDNSKNNKPDEANALTQFGYMCKQLGIELECTSVAQKKGRIERLFGTLQSRLVTELRIKGITDIDQANVFLNSYIKEYNKKFGSKVNHTTSVFETPPSKEDINLHLAVLSHRTINKGHHFRFKNHYFMPIDSDSNDVYFATGTKILVIKAFDGNLFASVGENVYALKQLDLHQHYSKEFDQIPEQKETKIYIPDFKHPWKYGNFAKFVYEFELSPKEWEDLRYSSQNLLANVDEILRHFNF